jgi:hypothetical protein
MPDSEPICQWEDLKRASRPERQQQRQEARQLVVEARQTQQRLYTETAGDRQRLLDEKEVENRRLARRRDSRRWQRLAVRQRDDEAENARRLEENLPYLIEHVRRLDARIAVAKEHEREARRRPRGKGTTDAVV